MTDAFPGGQDRSTSLVLVSAASITCASSSATRASTRSNNSSPTTCKPGGQVPTALVALQRWGLRTAYIGSFGDDPGGTLARTALATEGVDLSATVVRAATPQQVSVILIDEISGERSVLWERVEGLVLGPDEVPREHVVAGVCC